VKIKMLEGLPYGLRNIVAYWRKMLLEFVPSPSYTHVIWPNPNFVYILQTYLIKPATQDNTKTNLEKRVSTNDL